MAELVKGLSGICNMGNTCYINSALQCLSNTEQLTKFFLEQKFRDTINLNRKESKICEEYYRLLNGLWEDNCIIQPISFKRVLGKLDSRFNDNQQHDAQEFLFALLDFLHTSLSYEVNIYHKGVAKNDIDKKMIESIDIWSKHFNKEYSVILDLFYGQFYSRLICKKCNHISNNFDPFSMVSLQVLQHNTNIYECFDEFIKYEELDFDNKWKCEKCLQLTNAIKDIHIWKAPNILIIVLKRFDFGVNYSSKITNVIDFPLENLNLEKYVSGYDKNNAIYDAFGIIYHHGSMDFGHYTTACKNNGKWYLYDDDSVSEYSEINKLNAYVLFYRKRN